VIVLQSCGNLECMVGMVGQTKARGTRTTHQHAEQPSNLQRVLDGTNHRVGFQYGDFEVVAVRWGLCAIQRGKDRVDIEWRAETSVQTDVRLARRDVNARIDQHEVNLWQWHGAQDFADALRVPGATLQEERHVRTKRFGQCGKVNA
jgi:hypothetical protein